MEAAGGVPRAGEGANRAADDADRGQVGSYSLFFDIEMSKYHNESMHDR